MSKLALALLLGLLLMSAPLLRAEEDDYDSEEDSEDGSAAEGASDEKDVVVVTKDNWPLKAKYALVEFYAPWCGHCQKLAPEWAKAATAIKAHDPSIAIAKCDATAEADIAQKYEVQGYPTIKWFVDGEVAMDYSGPREADGIVQWVKKKTGPPATTVEDKDTVKAAEEAAEVLVLGYFKDFKGDEYDAFIKVAQKAEDVAFAQTKSADAAKAAGLMAPGVVIVTNFEGEDRGMAVLKGKVTEEALDEHVKAEKLPPTIVFNDKNSQKIFGAGIERQLLLVANAKDLKPDAKVFKAFRTAAAAHKGKLVFVTVDLDGTSKDPVVNFFGIKEEDAPVIVGFEMNANKKYKLTDTISEKSVAKFAEGMSAGSLTPEYKSAAVPDEPFDGGVTVIVGKNFDKIVKDAGKDVLLEVYAPWCGHCKTLEPIYKKLAKRLAKVDSVVIAKMDGTENEHPDVDVKGFPTIILFPAGKDAAPIPYEGGDRSLKSLTKFLKKNAAKSFELPKKGKGSKEEDDEAAAEAEEAEVKDEL